MVLDTFCADIRSLAGRKFTRTCYKNGYNISVGLETMSIQTLSRYGVALFLAALVSGCSLIGSSHSGRNNDLGRDNECKVSRSSCMYDGPYEPGERAYAEQEAARLNQAASEKLHRSSGR